MNYVTHLLIVNVTKSKNMTKKLYRDKIPSMTKNGFKVGIYIKLKKDELYNRSPATEILLIETTPKKADEIIKIWNNKK